MLLDDPLPAGEAAHPAKAAMKTAELEGITLDYWVAKAEGHFRDQLAGYHGLERDCPISVETFERLNGRLPDSFRPSTNWAQGGPIIERNQIITAPYADRPHGPMSGWGAMQWGHPELLKGPTPLIAAMRCFVASKFGEEVPDDGGYIYRRIQTGTITDPEVKKATDAALHASIAKSLKP